MVKKLIYADFWKKNSGISACMPRANSAETSGHNALPAPPSNDETLKLPCDDKGAGGHRAVRDTRWRRRDANTVVEELAVHTDSKLTTRPIAHWPVFVECRWWSIAIGTGRRN